MYQINGAVFLNEEVYFIGGSGYYINKDWTPPSSWTFTVQQTIIYSSDKTLSTCYSIEDVPGQPQSMILD
jgi:hypothetical protein